MCFSLLIFSFRLTYRLIMQWSLVVPEGRERAHSYLRHMKLISWIDVKGTNTRSHSYFSLFLVVFLLQGLYLPLTRLIIISFITSLHAFYC